MITWSEMNGVGVIRINEALTAATVDAFHDEMIELQEAQPQIKQYVMDLEAVDFLDSAGLGTLMASLKWVTERGGDMKICHLQKKPRMVFEVTRAIKVFEIFDSVDEAVNSF